MREKIDKFLNKLGSYMMVALVVIILGLLWYNYSLPYYAGKRMFYEDYYYKHNR